LHAAFKDIVLKGVLAPAGMERFDDILSEKDVDNIHAYLIDQSWVAYREQEAAAGHAEATTAHK
jgi:quinohemoprotein ethanol dehydrogenase